MSVMDGPLPFAGTLCPARSSICEIHADLSPRSRCHTVLLRPKQTRLPTMSTIELVDPELRDALALWPQVPPTAETLAQRRAEALALLRSVPTPDLPDITKGEIHVESAFGAKPIGPVANFSRPVCSRVRVQDDITLVAEGDFGRPYFYLWARGCGFSRAQLPYKSCPEKLCD